MRRRLAATALATIAAVAFATPAHAADLLTDRIDVADCAATVRVHDSASGYTASIIAALGTISAASGVAFTEAELGEAADITYLAADLSAYAYASADGSVPLGIYTAGTVVLTDPVGTGSRFMPWITLHETGHALGLPHSDDFQDVMYPFFYGQRTRLMGASDELAAIGRANGCRA